MSNEAAAAATCGGAALKKGPWTAAEDEVLLEYVKKHGEGNWNAVQKNTGLHRCGKSCRLRWSNHLRPNLKKGSFSAEEELLILRLHSQLGNKWARMAAHLPGRTDNEIKNYWNTRLKRRQRAGLPIYPPDIHCQHRASLSPTSTPPLTPTLTDNKSHHYPQMPSSCMNPMATIPLMAPSQFAARPVILQLPMMKPYSGDPAFQQSPLSPASPHTPQLHSQYQHQRLFHAMQYNSGNFNFNPVNYQPVFVKAELPSNQMFPGDAGSDAVLDAMLLETQCLCGGSLPPEQANGGDDFKWSPLGAAGDGGQDSKWSPLASTGDGNLQGCQSTDVRGVSKPKDSGGLTDDDLGTKVKAEPVEVAAPTVTPTAPVLPDSDWYDHHHQDISDGIPLTEADDIRLEMQQLASSLSVPPVTGSWNSTTEPYSGWDSLPGICS